jgi:AraC family transcriptional regulator
MLALSSSKFDHSFHLIGLDGDGALTRSQRSHLHWTEEIEVSQVCVSENLVSGICVEVTDRCIADVRLQDVLKSHDPIVTAAVAGITREAQQQALGGTLAKAVATQLTVHLLRK